jgi:hypothetical protein
MSIQSSVANYGGRIDTQQGNIKQFVSSSDSVNWIYKNIKVDSTSKILKVITPETNRYPVYINNDLIVTGTITGNTNSTTSDERLKKNIENINKEFIDKFFELNPLTFSYKNDNKEKKHYGLLAQEVEKIYPELVENNISGYKTINYIELIPLMISKLKDMEIQIKVLKQEITKK